MKKLPLIFLLVFTAATAAIAAPTAAPLHEITAVEQASDVSQGNGSLTLSVGSDAEGAVRFMIYSITGQMVKRAEVAPGEELTVELPAGYYIVKTAQWSKRVVVK